MLNTRKTIILRELMRAKSNITSEDLATVIQVTSRTVRNEIKELVSIISQNGGGIKSIRGSGYELVVSNEHQFREFLKENFHMKSFGHDTVPTLPEDRVHFLIKRLLLAENYLKIDDLAEELFISRSTIQNDLRDVKKILGDYEIALESRPNYGFRVKGKELKLRFCMSEYIFNRTDTNTDLYEIQNVVLTKENMSVIKETILEQIKKNHITLSDISLNNLVIHIAIACRRIQYGNYVSIPAEELTDVIKEKEFEVSRTIIHTLESKLHVSFPEREVAYIAIHLLGTRMAHLDEEDTELQSFVDTDIFQLTIKILAIIEQELMLGINQDKELMVALCLHLKPAINRFKYGMNLRNPILSDIKVNYPVAFEAGVLAGRVLRNETGIDINDHEIGYLALHIGAAIERKDMNIMPKRCIVVCASGMGSARLLSYKLKSKFGNKIEVVSITEYYKLREQPMQSIDFIISTIPIRYSLPKPIIEVKTFLGEEDFVKIQNVFAGNSDQDIQYTNENLVFLQEKLESKEEVFQFLSCKLQNLGLINQSFMDSVMEREAICPTSFGNLVAIPHPVAPLTEKTFWAVCTLQKPIDWGGNRVQIICLLSVEKNSTGDFQRLYDLLGSVIDSSAKVQKLLKCLNYREFIDVFLKG